jgi:hypothetical protein
MDLSARLDHLRPWSGLIAAGSGWYLHQQLVSEALHFDCRVTADGVGIAIGVAALLLVAVGALLSWRARPPGTATAGPAVMRRFIADLSLLAAALAVLGIGFQILAGFLLPGCRP